MKDLHPRPGDRVRVRQRTWVVQHVDVYGVHRVLTLGGRAADQPHRTLRVISPFDDVERVVALPRLQRIGIRAWRHACRALRAEHGPSWALHSATSANIDLLPYQLEPALALLTGLGSRILIADEVGLGKTVQAMLAIAELRARGRAARVLVVCPAGLREQWAGECATRFGLPLTILDQRGLRRVRSALQVGVNPWSVEPAVVTSIDFVKRPEVLEPALDAPWDVLIVDEAHNACGASDRREAVAALCRRAPYVLLLTATPHNGDETAFATLCGLGSHGQSDRLVVFRRSRAEVGRDAGRRAHTVRVRSTTAGRRMHAALAALTRAVRREHRETDRGVWLVLSLLHKRALSSPHALAASTERRLLLLASGAPADVGQMLLPWDDDHGELDGSDAAPMWSEPALRDERHERQLLERLLTTSRQAEAVDAKLHALRRLLRRIHEPVIVFTEYRDTLFHLREQVAPHATVLHGGMTREQRRTALDAFGSGGVLLATDAAGEGLNLHEHCRTVINLELPWNPMRLEQRVGRVDRIGQRRCVHLVHLVSTDGGEARLLERLARRLHRADSRVGAPNPFIGRPEWTEDESARMVVLREEPGRSRAGIDACPSIPLTRLPAEGEAEAVRLTTTRVLAGAEGLRADANETARTTFVARARRQQTRAMLAGRRLMLRRSILVDGNDRIVAAHVDGVLSTTGRMDRWQADTAVSPREPGPEDDGSVWHAASVRAHVDATTEYLRRVRSTIEQLDVRGAEVQPGLFDRRVELAAMQDADRLEAARAIAGERIDRAQRSLVLTVSPPEACLVMDPAAHGTP